jgi:hypothetical protein
MKGAFHMYYTHIQEKVNELSKNITALQEHTEDVGSDIKDTFTEVLEALGKKRDAVQHTLKQCAASGAEAWDDLSSGLEAALKDLEDSYTNAASYLEHKRKNLYISHIKERLDDFEQKIEVLRTRMNRFTEPDLKTTLIEALATLRVKYQTARSALKDLQSTDPEHWEESKSEMYGILEDMEAAYNTTVAYFPEHQEEYHQRLETTLTELDKKIAALQKRADTTTTDNHATINESIQQLRKKQVVARNTYREFEIASTKAWQKFKAKMDTMIEELEQSYEKTSSLFQ